ncbi:MAG: helix-turn-helix transcriptional regulator [Marmoricola sp.]
MLGAFIRAQREMANLSLRQLSAMTQVSNPYLSQVERGLHEPSVRVLKSIADALNVSAESLFEQAGWIKASLSGDDVATESAIRTDRRLTEAQRRALLGVYRSYIETSTEHES